MPGGYPNILFILSDDQGAWALGCAGNPEIYTPNLDRLAQSGVRMENFFCTSPVCSPARASLLTGQIPSQHGVHDWIRGGNAAQGEKASIQYLDGQLAYTDLLAEAGYVCGLSGKWHLGASDVPQKSFDHWFAHPAGGSGYQDVAMYRGTSLEPTEGYLTNVITTDALAFLNRFGSGPRPFYLSVHYTAPHSPWLNQHPAEFVHRYDDCPFLSCPQEPAHPGARFIELQFSQFIAKRQEEAVPIREYLKGYFASISAMDADIGRLLDRLEALGILEDTLVVFMSDNGFNCGQHGIWGKGNATFPLNLFDTSIKIPAIFAHPNRIPTGRVETQLLSGYDWMPTLLDYVGIPNPLGEAKLPGHSFAPLLQGSSQPETESVVIYDEYGPVRMVRTREWKYIHRYPYGPHQLFNLLHDPGERFDLLAEERVFYPGQPKVEPVVAHLKGLLEDWFHNYVKPEFDGIHEAVAGRGQVNLAGPAAHGQTAFHPPETNAYR